VAATPVDPPESRPVVLIVDDEDMIRTLVRSLLEANGYRVVEAENGRRAVEVLQQDLEDVDLLITDVRMPGLTGPELVRQMRAERPALPIIFISGYTGDAEMDHPACRATEYIAKPFPLPNLLAAVRRLLARNPLLV
jgi:two-component system cell cycle sensor histidine kinase/response regulator CckA